MIITFNINTIDVNSSNPERITKRTRHESAGFFLLKRLKFILKSNLKGKIQQLQSRWGSMLGMSHFLGSLLLSGSQKVPTSFLKRAFLF
jgi:hypothetical protein